MIAGHMDEVGAIVVNITPKGFIKNATNRRNKSRSFSITKYAN